MTPSKVVACMESAGLKCAHLQFTKGSAPPLPWAVYYLDTSADLTADNDYFEEAADWVVEVYEKSFDPSLHLSVKRAIADSFCPPTVEQYWVDEESCLMTTYRFREM